MSRALSRQEIQLLHQQRLLEASKPKTVLYNVPAKQDQPLRALAPEDQQRDQTNS